MSAMQLCDFPEEIIVQIFEELDTKDLLNCSLTCRLLRDVVQGALSLQYHLELAVSGLDDSGPASKLSTAERFANLNIFNEGWSNLRFREIHTAPMSPSNVWELFGGMIAHGVLTNGTRGLAFTELPSLLRDTPGRTWEHPNMGVHIRDFAIDPAQDLAVLIAHPTNPGVGDAIGRLYGIHLRAMSTGEDHRRAASPSLSCSPRRMREVTFLIQIMEEFLAVLFLSPNFAEQDQLFVWNWKTGQLITSLVASSMTDKMNSFSFLSARHFVISRFRILTENSSPILEVYDLFTPNSTTPRLRRSFELPEMIASATVVELLTRSDPSPQCSAWPSNSDSKPFHTAASSRLLTVSMHIVIDQVDLRTYMLFVHHSTLLDGLDAERSPDNITVPWEAWGPEKSRMLPTWYNESTWVCYVHGTRYVRLEPPDEEGSSRLRLLDFNQSALKRDVSRFSEPESSGCAVLASQPTVIVNDGVFKQDVVTTLPYREVCSSGFSNYLAVMMDQDCLVGLLQDDTDLQAISPVGLEFLCI